MLTIWKSLVQSKLDYCSQLWSPSDQGSIGNLESVARNFTSQVGGLAELRMYSQERRRERYQIIYVWKVSQLHVSGYTLPFRHHPRRGRLVDLPPVANGAPAAVKNAQEANLRVKIAKLFNSLQQELRNLDKVTVDTFKSNLDSWLEGVPDQPTISGRQRAAESNSLLHQVIMLDNFNL